MSKPSLLFAAVAAFTLLVTQGSAWSQDVANNADGYGTALTPEDLLEFFSIPPDGAGLPEGSGTAAQGKEVYAVSCAMCHGPKMESVPATGGPALVGGRGTLTDVPAIKTVESYWPYATTLFDYIKRAMPFHMPGSLTNDQVYAVTAYILAEGGIIEDDDVMNKTTLPKVKMPNAEGFIAYPNPDVRRFR